MLPVPEPPQIVRCPRCDGEDIEALGRVHSTLYWFSCFHCHCIWWLRSLPPTYALPHTNVRRDS